ncbi:glycosyltransferase [Effusibacillus dendaii]|uniref:Glycosyl transferase n=1 Tax=Effusibacillus dendaii TaxID=2743772 RepID=A0A7I8DCK7_9BACL|nr:glycosyltransferase [Effusibacillus dendaii]BCJ87757.1 glycosyl transferase [Effusibacillus dendaii]
MAAPAKILYIIGGGEFGGAEQHLLGLIQSLDREQWEPHVIVFYQGELAERLQQLQIPVSVISLQTARTLFGLRAVRKLIGAIHPDIVHTHGVRANLAGRLAKLSLPSGFKLITTIHSVLELDYPVPWKRAIFGFLEKRTWFLVDHFILVSRAMQQTLYQKGLPQNRTSVIHNAIRLPDQPPARPSFSRLRAELQLPQDAVLVGTVARLHKVKGHSYLMRAAGMLQNQFPDVHYVWIGGGELEAELKQAAIEAGLQQRIHFLGVRQDVAELLPQFDLFVLPSVSEGLSIALLEAMMSGVPVIATAVGGNPEVVAEGEDGMLVPSQDADALCSAIQSALSTPEQMKRMGQTGQQKVFQYYSLQRLVQETEEIYKKMMNRV